MIVLDEWQKKFLETKGDKIMCTGRQVGKTEVCAIDAAEYAINTPKSKPILMVAPTERQAYALFQKTLNYLTEKYFKQIKQGKDRPTKTRIVLKSGVEIYCLPVGATGTGIRGLTVGRLYVDEASRIPEDVWVALLPTLLATGGDSIYISTPHGVDGEFYRCWKNVDGVYGTFTRFSITSEVVIAARPISDTWSEIAREKALQKLEQAKARMSKREYAQEYLGEFDEGLHRWFSDKLLATVKRIPRGQAVPGKTYFLGVDVARMGEDKGTYTVMEYISRSKIIMRELIITEKKLTTETMDKILELERVWKFNKIGIDAGAGTLGVAIVDMLMRTPLKSKVVTMNNRSLIMDMEGKSKQRMQKEDMYYFLLALMEQGKIELIDDDELFDALRCIQYEYVTKADQPTQLRIFGNPHSATDIVEGMVRAAYCLKEKGLNLWVTYC